MPFPPFRFRWPTLPLYVLHTAASSSTASLGPASLPPWLSAGVFVDHEICAHPTSRFNPYLRLSLLCLGSPTCVSSRLSLSIAPPAAGLVAGANSPLVLGLRCGYAFAATAIIVFSPPARHYSRSPCSLMLYWFPGCL
ncbi:hypothetical protein DFH07DRAFT_972302 [Mycena maculata]|uniref:Uncharacterized protein n=1 Tax=Mycena maculata TaxID=230809 RepID=A0AAD7ML83_9AGAR|nr:hypothetical protein DFH07DRAFT_972302 [Mycena maculata]